MEGLKGMSGQVKLKTYWNGEPVRAVKVTVTVANKGTFKTPWFDDIVGQKRKAVEVVYGSSCFYLDDENGSGWDKVTHGKGSPHIGHRQLEIDESSGVFPR